MNGDLMGGDIAVLSDRMCTCKYGALKCGEERNASCVIRSST